MESRVEAGKLQPGRWQGEYIDAFGYRSDVELALEVDGTAVRGSVEFMVRTEDEPVLITGSVEGEMAGERGVASMRITETEEVFENEIHLRSGGSHASQALFGVATSTGMSGFGGGVFIVWKFEQPEE